MTDALIAELNTASLPDFTRRLEHIYEHSAWIGAAAWTRRPFENRAALHAAMQDIVRTAPETAQLDLIRAHPDLAGKLARGGNLAAHSAGEQKGLGLDQLPDAEYERFDSLNTAYRTRFDFPFIIAVRAHTRESVLAAFVHRLGNDPDRERETALEEIGKIAGFRLQDLA